ncbi:hypothetical protein CHS0354_023552 [Potamilus streckersoni]|uniref:Integrase zinc-binding domain-containing protein n=1 Tax=Potamilus streckersoni TaxID=2493646 RepID=A0AAE0S8A5_9BIVA|nr:hypothetical protein CHS0354_023552 [Potamilus streckersoni]
MDTQPYHEIREYLTKKSYPKRMKLEWQKKIRRDCRNFLVQKGILFRKGKGTNLYGLREKGLEEVLESIHSLPNGGHLGINKTYKKMRDNFSKGLFEKVKKYVENCDV